MSAAAEPRGYGDVGPVLHHLGWTPLPLPAGKKSPPPKGWTGKGAPLLSYADVMAFAEDHQQANTAMRLGPNGIGIDGDAYDDRAGAATLTAAEAAWGVLPPTVRTTSRLDGVSGIRLYRVPAGVTFVENLDGLHGLNVDVIQHNHRYVVAPGSTHPNGAVYQLLDHDGSVLQLDALPRPDDLPELPAAWVTGLTARPKTEPTDSMFGPQGLDKHRGPVGPGGRRAAARDYSCYLRRRSVGHDLAEKLLQVRFADFAQPAEQPFTWGEAQRELDGAYCDLTPGEPDLPTSDPTAGAEADPIPLTVGAPLIPFPTQALPTPVKAMVEAAAAALQVDVGATATSALTSMAAACGGRVFIQLKPGWMEPTNLYTGTVADPGERKSSTQEVMVTGLVEAEQALDEAGEADRHKLTYERDVAEKAFEKAKISAGRADAGADRDAALALVKQEHDRLLQLVVPAQPQIVFGDLTPEATAMALQDQGGKVAVITAEGGLFGTLAGRYSGGQANIDVFTQGYSGEAIRVKRVGRDDVKVPRACITLGLMLQPEVMREVGGNKALTGRGLVDRFLFCEPKSLVGHRDSRSTSIPADVKTSYDNCIKELVLSLEKQMEQGGNPITLTLSTQAQETFYGVMDRVEEQMAPDGDCHEIRGWAAKHAARIGRIAALLHMVEHGTDNSVVSDETVMSAAAIGWYYLAHALRAYSQMKLDGDTQDAVYVLTRLRQHFARDKAGDTITARDILRLCRKFRTKDELIPALTRLVDNGWIFPNNVKNDGPGRPPSPTYSPHPKLRSKTGSEAA